MNSLQANRVTDKLTHVHDRIYCCRSGSAADTQAVADAVHYQLQLYTYVCLKVNHHFLTILPPSRQMSGGPPPVHTAASLFQEICYQNKDALSAGIIVAGWDKDAGPSVYNIPLGGGLFRQPWAIGGMFHMPHIVFFSLHDSLYQALVRHMSTVTVMLHTRRVGVVTKRSIS